MPGNNGVARYPNRVSKIDVLAEFAQVGAHQMGCTFLCIRTALPCLYSTFLCLKRSDVTMTK